MLVQSENPCFILQILSALEFLPVLREDTVFKKRNQSQFKIRNKDFKIVVRNSEMLTNSSIVPL